MAIIPEFEEDQKPEAQQKPSSSSSAPPLCGDADDDALYPVLERRGPLAYPEAAIDLVRQKFDFFKDEAAVTKVTTVVSAAKAKADADERAREQAKREVKKAAPSPPPNVEAPVKMEVDTPSEQPKVEEGIDRSTLPLSFSSAKAKSEGSEHSSPAQFPLSFGQRNFFPLLR